MTDEAAFIRAVIARPDDDAPRLVYADWLDENAGTVPCPVDYGPGPFKRPAHHNCQTCGGTGVVSDGRCERAEFIRVQCKLNTWDWGPRWTEADHIGMKCQCTGCDLRRRELELRGVPMNVPGSVSYHFWSFFDRLPGDPGFQYTLRRGFVESVTCTAEDWLAHADAIVAAQPVRGVTLSTWPELDFDFPTDSAALTGRERRYSGEDIHKVIPGGDANHSCTLMEYLLRQEWPSVKTWHLPPAEHPMAAVRREMLRRISEDTEREFLGLSR